MWVYRQIDQSSFTKGASHDTTTSTHDRRHAHPQLRDHYATQLCPLCRVQADGGWLPAQLENASLTRRTFSTTVRSASALLVSFGNGNIVVANSAGGQTEIAPNSLASAYG